MLNTFSVDVEECFHVSEVQNSVGRSTWPSLPSRVETGSRRLLEMLAEHHTQATFFMLGWVAQRHPGLVRAIASEGHEIGCHSFEHRLVYHLTPAQFRADTTAAQHAIEDACGISPKVYRAPSFSITRRSVWALDVLAGCGFTHDSSIYPIVHDRYGIPGFGRFAQVISTPSGPIVEVPVATVQLFPGGFAPAGGGGYVRLLPYRYTSAAVRRINLLDRQSACIYVHSWELDTDQPKLATGLISRVRTYAGLAGMPTKIANLLRDFRFSSIAAVHKPPAADHHATSVREPAIR